MFQQQLAPKDLEGPLRVLVLGRSSPHLQTEDRRLAALDKSWSRAAEFVRASYDWPVEFSFIGNLDGAEAVGPLIPQALMLIEAGDWDLVVAEDLTRISRYTNDLSEFMQACGDADVRVISVVDNFDTAMFDNNAS